MALAFSTKAFSISAPSVWNSLSYQCRSAELFSSFRHILKLNCSILRIVNVNSLPSVRQYAPLIRLRCMALYKFVLIDWWGRTKKRRDDGTVYVGQPAVHLVRRVLSDLYWLLLPKCDNSNKKYYWCHCVQLTVISDVAYCFLKHLCQSNVTSCYYTVLDIGPTRLGIRFDLSN